jgi:hypothetical protein
LNEKGYHSFSSIHEILGVVDEEHHELKDAVKHNNHEEIKQELLDIAVGCIWGVVSINENALDW